MAEDREDGSPEDADKGQFEVLDEVGEVEGWDDDMMPDMYEDEDEQDEKEEDGDEPGMKEDDSVKKDMKEDDGAKKDMKEEDRNKKGVMEDDGTKKGMKEDEGAKKDMKEEDRNKKDVKEDDGAEKGVKDDDGVKKGVKGDDVAKKGMKGDDVAKKGMKGDDVAKKGMKEGEGAKNDMKEDEGAKKDMKEEVRNKKGVKEDDGAKKGVKDDDGVKKGVKGDDVAKKAVKEDDGAKKAVKEDDGAKKGVKEDASAKKGVKEDDGDKKGVMEVDGMTEALSQCDRELEARTLNSDIIIEIDITDDFDTDIKEQIVILSDDDADTIKGSQSKELSVSKDAKLFKDSPKGKNEISVKEITSKDEKSSKQSSSMEDKKSSTHSSISKDEKISKQSSKTDEKSQKLSSTSTDERLSRDPSKMKDEKSPKQSSTVKDEKSPKKFSKSKDEKISKESSKTDEKSQKLSSTSKDERLLKDPSKMKDEKSPKQSSTIKDEKLLKESSKTKDEKAAKQSSSKDEKLPKLSSDGKEAKSSSTQSSGKDKKVSDHSASAKDGKSLSNQSSAKNVKHTNKIDLTSSEDKRKNSVTKTLDDKKKTDTKSSESPKQITGSGLKRKGIGTAVRKPEEKKIKLSDEKTDYKKFMSDEEIDFSILDPNKAFMVMRKQFVKTMIALSEDLKCNRDYRRWAEKRRKDGMVFPVFDLKQPAEPTLLSRCQLLSGYEKSSTKLCLGFPRNNDVIRFWSGEKKFVPKIKSVVRAFEDVMRSCGKPLWDPVSQQGYFHGLSVVANVRGKAVLQVDVFGATEREAEARFSEVKDILLTGFGSRKVDQHALVSSIYVGLVVGKKTRAAERTSVRCIMGCGFIVESVDGMKVNVYPWSGFSTGTCAMTTLCEEMTKIVRREHCDIVVEIGCGTGVIGQVLSRHCSTVLGVDTAECIAEARVNAEGNGLSNCTYYDGRVKDGLAKVAEAIRNSKTPVLVIVNGLFCDLLDELAVLEFLQVTEEVHKVAYIKSVSKFSENQLGSLCEPKNILRPGPNDPMPFLPLYAVPLDLGNETFTAVMVLKHVKEDFLGELYAQREKYSPRRVCVARFKNYKPLAGAQVGREHFEKHCQNMSKTETYLPGRKSSEQNYGFKDSVESYRTIGMSPSSSSNSEALYSEDDRQDWNSESDSEGRDSEDDNHRWDGARKVWMNEDGMLVACVAENLPSGHNLSHNSSRTVSPSTSKNLSDNIENRSVSQSHPDHYWLDSYEDKPEHRSHSGHHQSVSSEDEVRLERHSGHHRLDRSEERSVSRIHSVHRSDSLEEKVRSRIHSGHHQSESSYDAEESQSISCRHRLKSLENRADLQSHPGHHQSDILEDQAELRSQMRRHRSDSLEARTVSRSYSGHRSHRSDSLEARTVSQSCSGHLADSIENISVSGSHPVRNSPECLEDKTESSNRQDRQRSLSLEEISEAESHSSFGHPEFFDDKDFPPGPLDRHRSISLEDISVAGSNSSFNLDSLEEKTVLPSIPGDEPNSSEHVGESIPPKENTIKMSSEENKIGADIQLLVTDDIRAGRLVENVINNDSNMKVLGSSFTDDIVPPGTEDSVQVPQGEKEMVDKNINNDKKEVIVNDKKDIENDQKVEIKNDQKVEIENDQKVEIENDQKVEIENDQKVEIESDHKVEIENDHKVEIENDKKVEIENDQKIEIENDKKIEIENDKKVVIDNNKKVDIDDKNVVIENVKKVETSKFPVKNQKNTKRQSKTLKRHLQRLRAMKRAEDAERSSWNKNFEHNWPRYGREVYEEYFYMRDGMRLGYRSEDRMLEGYCITRETNTNFQGSGHYGSYIDFDDDVERDRRFWPVSNEETVGITTDMEDFRFRKMSGAAKRNRKGKKQTFQKVPLDKKTLPANTEEQSNSGQKITQKCAKEETVFSIPVLQNRNVTETKRKTVIKSKGQASLVLCEEVVQRSDFNNMQFHTGYSEKMPVPNVGENTGHSPGTSDLNSEWSMMKQSGSVWGGNPPIQNKAEEFFKQSLTSLLQQPPPNRHEWGTASSLQQLHLGAPGSDLQPQQAQELFKVNLTTMLQQPPPNVYEWGTTQGRQPSSVEATRSDMQPVQGQIVLPPMQNQVGFPPAQGHNAIPTAQSHITVPSSFLERILSLAGTDGSQNNTAQSSNLCAAPRWTTASGICGQNASGWQGGGQQNLAVPSQPIETTQYTTWSSQRPEVYGPTRENSGSGMSISQLFQVQGAILPSGQGGVNRIEASSSALPSFSVPPPNLGNTVQQQPSQQFQPHVSIPPPSQPHPHPVTTSAASTYPFGDVSFAYSSGTMQPLGTNPQWGTMRPSDTLAPGSSTVSHSGNTGRGAQQTLEDSFSKMGYYTKRLSEDSLLITGPGLRQQSRESVFNAGSSTKQCSGDLSFNRDSGGARRLEENLFDKDFGNVISTRHNSFDKDLDTVRPSGGNSFNYGHDTVRSSGNQLFNYGHGTMRPSEDNTFNYGHGTLRPSEDNLFNYDHGTMKPSGDNYGHGALFGDSSPNRDTSNKRHFRNVSPTPSPSMKRFRDVSPAPDSGMMGTTTRGGSPISNFGMMQRYRDSHPGLRGFRDVSPDAVSSMHTTREESPISNLDIMQRYRDISPSSSPGLRGFRDVSPTAGHGMLHFRDVSPTPGDFSFTRGRSMTRHSRENSFSSGPDDYLSSRDMSINARRSTMGRSDDMAFDAGLGGMQSSRDLSFDRGADIEPSSRDYWYNI
ncbi:uncharacterized protein LOC134537450 isoform X1 [Bacillus rossius redtenbacheri]|uniref:uncharacterized protein LOC134537450 isoform X1 n=1 Tax=Bacillus rossius redtenbacheri TaxID=93214 RepID=UPI002FDE30AF